MLGHHDKLEMFSLTQKLCSRSNENSTLLSACDRESLSSSFEIVFAKGASGMRKTALAMELNKEVMKE